MTDSLHAGDEIEEIISGTPTRVVLDVPRRIERLKAKAAKLKAHRT